MTNEERIEAMAKAIAEVDADETDDPWEELNPLSQWAYRRMAKAALAAAGVEEMVREAAVKAACGESQYQWGLDSSDIDEIVREVMNT